MPWYEEQHYQLLRDMLHQTKSKIIPTEETYRLLRENGLSGTCFPSLDPTLVDASIYQQFRIDYLEYIRRGTLQEEAILELHELFQKNQIRHVFLKGSHLRKLYPEALLRSMGDIDLLIEQDQMKRAHEGLPTKGYLLHAPSTAHDCFHKGNKVVVEVHPILENQFDHRYKKMFEDVWGHVELDGDQEVFDSIYEVAYLSYHMIKHLSTSGIGIRNILDMALYLSLNRHTMNHEDLHRYFLEIGMDQFFQNMVLLAIRMFQMDELNSFITIEPNESLLEETAKFISQSGVHGQGHAHNQFLSGMGKQAMLDESIQKGKFHYLVKLAFPSKPQLEGAYHYLTKAPWLLPWAWIQRWFRLLFLRTKRTLRRMRKLHVDEEEIERVKSLYHRLGL